jgi:uncharacterized protein YxjI
MRFYVKEGILLAGDNFVVRDDAKNEIYRVESNFFQLVDHFVIRDSNTGEEVCDIKRRLFEKTREYTISQGGHERATVRKTETAGPRNIQFEIHSSDGMVFHIRGSFDEWDFEVVDHYGRLLGHISRAFAILGDHYTVDTAPNVDPTFVIAIAIILDEAKEDRVA